MTQGLKYIIPNQIARAREWLRPQGLTLISIPFPAASTMAEIFQTMGFTNPGIPFLFAGTSKIGCNHQVVVAPADGIVCDPSGSGIVGPCTDGNWWVDYIGKLLP